MVVYILSARNRESYIDNFKDISNRIEKDK